MLHLLLDLSGKFMLVLYIAIIVRAIISWFPVSPSNPFIIVLQEFTEPVMRPFRRIIPPFGMLDLSAFVAVIAVAVVQHGIGDAMQRVH